jgi:hypothetical protein
VVVKVLLVVALVALVIYLVIRVIERRRSGPRPPEGGGRTEPRVTGPDDDPDFLRDLDRRRKRRQEHGDS